MTTAVSWKQIKGIISELSFEVFQLSKKEAGNFSPQLIADVWIITQLEGLRSCDFSRGHSKLREKSVRSARNGPSNGGEGH